ncbi:Epithelial sodium channel, partial [Trinorchestia longiramus]
MRRALRRWLLSDPNLGVAYVQLVGLTTVASHRAHWARRAAWLVILIGGCCLATFYMVIQVSLYLAGHVGVSVSPSSNTTTQLPAVTICVEQKYDFHNLLWLWRKYGPGGHMPGDADLQLLDHANLTLSYIWRHGGYKLDSLIKECLFGPGNSCEDKGSWLPVFTEYGLCYTYSGGYTRLDGHMYGLYIKMNYSGHPYGLPFQGFKVVVHDARSPAVVRINDGFLCPVKENKFGCFIMQSVEMK